ncbi:MAG: sulfurtransferase complex subunit TusD [Gammaproteobacteria bacterium]|nr:sulfurtransferase complex subunit TusD [Gammaproteobacteria bacterium]
MIFSLAVYGSPYTYQSSDSAYQFARELLNQGHEIYRIFFYHDGVYNANRLTIPPQDEINISSRWSSFAGENNIELVVCVASALRRGVLDDSESRRYEKDTHNIEQNFTLSGLGQLIDAGIVSDRLVTFGS